MEKNSPVKKNYTYILKIVNRFSRNQIKFMLHTRAIVIISLLEPQIVYLIGIKNVGLFQLRALSGVMLLCIAVAANGRFIVISFL